MSLFNQIRQSQLFKVSSLNSFSVLLKIGIGLITSKVLAVFVGPSGLALVGNMRNFVSLFESFATLGFQNGIIRYVASNKDDKDKLASFISTALIVLIGLAFLLSLLLFFGVDLITSLLFESGSIYSIAITVFAITLPFHSISIFLISVLNGLGKYQKVIYTTIIGNLLGLFFTVFLVTKLYTLGALLAIIITPALLFGVTLYFLNKEIKLLQLIKFQFFNWNNLNHLYSFTVMALFTAIVSPLVFLVLRNYIIDSIGLSEAGYWEAMSRIATYYFMFLSTLLTVYFLPKLSEAVSIDQTKSVFQKYYKTIFPVFVMVLVVIYFLRFFIIKLLFTDEFLPISDLFIWQLLGDLFKAASVILGYEFFAKKLTKAYLITESLSFGLLLSSSYILIPKFGIEGIVMAHSLTYALYFLVLLVYFRKSLV
ncbi:O-antigen translocase [Flavobacterium sp. UBA6135]|uniref:O-antigen translocase n=1 Tax=Flavobacterium sp. UBA6135 TaxID=1946553 RepID=UPI0025C5DB7F|nr:O-antigen translocase [Flavobacterium sp. UBA6135]